MAAFIVELQVLKKNQSYVVLDSACSLLSQKIFFFLFVGISLVLNTNIKSVWVQYCACFSFLQLSGLKLIV